MFFNWDVIDKIMLVSSIEISYLIMVEEKLVPL